MTRAGHRTGPPRCGNAGHGPIRLISPRMTETSWGSSSMLVARRSRPTFVTRGSCATLNSGPPPRSLRCEMSPIRRSASTLIERSFGISKVVPLRPTRRWRKMTGPRSSTLMATAPIIRSGAVTISTTTARVTSSSRLTNRWQPRSRGFSRQSSVSCPIGAARTSRWSMPRSPACTRTSVPARRRARSWV